jgi:hypothetical protein
MSVIVLPSALQITTVPNGTVHRAPPVIWVIYGDFNYTLQKTNTLHITELYSRHLMSKHNCIIIIIIIIIMSLVTGLFFLVILLNQQ